MCALLGADLEKAVALAATAAAEPLEGGRAAVCQVANDNDPGQVVLSGHAEAIERAIALAKEHGVKRAVKLPVSAPFHCELMGPAAEAMAEALQETPPAQMRLPICANVTATLVGDPAVEQELLVRQVTGRVRWRESVLAMGGLGIEHFIELGGKVLGPMVGRTLPDATTISVVTMADIEALAKELA